MISTSCVPSYFALSLQCSGNCSEPLIAFRESYRVHGFKVLDLPCRLTFVFFSWMNVAHGHLDAGVTKQSRKRRKVYARRHSGSSRVHRKTV
jgi:hypothetical protein